MKQPADSLTKIKGVWEQHRPAFPVYALVTFFSLITLYLLWTAKDIEAVFFDTYEIYIDAKLFAGVTSGIYYWKRPPLLPWCLAPVFRFLDLQTAMLISKVLAVGFFAGLLGASYRLFRLFSGRLRAATGIFLMGINALLLHYAPFVKEDIPAAFLTVLTFGTYLHARKNRTIALYAATGLLLSLAVVTRFNMFPWMAATLALYELISPEQRTGGFPFLWIQDAWKKLIFFFFFPLLFFWVTVPFSWAVANRMPWIASLGETSEALWNYYTKFLDSRDSPLAILWFLERTFTWPLLLLCGIGLYTAWKRRTHGALFMGLWLSVFLAQQSTLTHQEARYLFPVFPPVCYFIACGMAALGRILIHGPDFRFAGRRVFRWAMLLGGFLSCVPYAGAFAEELRKFQDPFYRAPYARNVSRLAESLAHGKDIYWVGKMYPLHPEQFVFHPLDQAAYIYHFYNHTVQFYTDKRIWVLDPDESFFTLPQQENYMIFVADLARRVRDGDVCIINPNKHYGTRNLPAWIKPLWVQRCKILPFTRVPLPDANSKALRFVGTKGPMALQSKIRDGKLYVEMTGIPKGIYQLYVRLDNDPKVHMSAFFDSVDGSPSFTVPAPKGSIQSCFLLTFDRVYVFPHPERKNTKEPGYEIFQR